MLDEDMIVLYILCNSWSKKKNDCLSPSESDGQAGLEVQGGNKRW